ncbi:hypothetical protein HMPREF0058_0628 [Actinomyces urogenitalis DSM 15434]|uniref:Uncharacterized protein n=1 Tax=Actinomyces urogenitalis DSM 15434 TaxID=525246 RepID=C0W434_9ACTO|nr:hypothetical protein HMPREF0058_0628 [Actinomyces urogenitalis DSM 15434]
MTQPLQSGSDVVGSDPGGTADDARILGSQRHDCLGHSQGLGAQVRERDLHARASAGAGSQGGEGGRGRGDKVAARLQELGDLGVGTSGEGGGEAVRARDATSGRLRRRRRVLAGGRARAAGAGSAWGAHPCHITAPATRAWWHGPR